MKIELVSCSAYSGEIFGESVTNPEALFIAIARVSSNRAKEERGFEIEGLIDYCVKNGHWSIFEMVNVCLYIETSLAIATQMLRHKSFSFQMFSQRYNKPLGYEPVELRTKGKGNRQSSSVKYETSMDIEGVINNCFNAYKALLSEGVSYETARFLLPTCTTTELFMNGSLRSWIHYIQQRNTEHTQKEHRIIAKGVKDYYLR